ncbi:hypothetical protein PVL29_009119 [Vitis rotundifolia]|uniref:40S ribosomal protein S8 n=1 Tax=Vitis rotundifolia TaxID=103349 RepID=A0AA38ZYK5_VITRO|nr:hypothetical protein PVL29_009119 [Vitis rotundifolia]
MAKMGISCDSLHKRHATGDKKKACDSSPIGYELDRQPANTKLSSNKTVRRVHVRGGNVKWRALKLNTGNYSWGSEAVTCETRILNVIYNASNSELVRTQTLVKSAIKSSHVLRKLEKRQADCKLDPHIEEQFGSDRLLACISSHPGQCGRLEFYTRKI